MEKQGSLPPIALIGLALLAVPRVVLHDLDVVQEGDLVNLLLVVVPPLVWVVVAVVARVPRPFLTLLVVGGLYGVLLALGHQVFWDRNGGGDVTLGGNLAGRLPLGAEQVVIRTFSVFSSFFTGLLVGAVTGLVAWGAGTVLRRGQRT